MEERMFAFCLMIEKLLLRIWPPAAVVQRLRRWSQQDLILESIS